VGADFVIGQSAVSLACGNSIVAMPGSSLFPPWQSRAVQFVSRRHSELSLRTRCMLSWVFENPQSPVGAADSVFVP